MNIEQANQLLQQLREQTRAERAGEPVPLVSGSVAKRRQAAGIDATLWERHAIAPLALCQAPPVAEPGQQAGRGYDYATTVRIFPTIAQAFLQNDIAPAGRLWLLMHNIDEDGRGWLPVSAIKQAFCGVDSVYRLSKATTSYESAWRGVRQLLNAGAGLLWTWCKDTDRIFLAGSTTLAERLGLPRLEGRAVEVPVKHLTGSIGEIRAALYATFDSGRQERPISRQAKEEVTGVSRWTQRRYESRLGIEPVKNYATDTRLTTESQQEAAWSWGMAHFGFVDARGRQGRAGVKYNARQLPNSYPAKFPTTSGRKRKQAINSALRHAASMGRGQCTNADYRRRYYEDAKGASKGVGEVYWRANKVAGPPGKRRQFWYTFHV